jgi:Tfp pilus assembly protein PilF
LGLAYFSLHDLVSAEASVRQAIALDPRTPDAYTLLANVDFAKGSIENAKSDLRTAIEANPRKLTNYVALGTEYEKEGNWEEAKKLFEKAHEVDATSSSVAAELAFLYLEHGGDVNVALSLAQMAKQRQSAAPYTSDALGWAYYKLGALDSALAELKDCVQKMPSNAVFQYHLGMANLAAGHAAAAERSLQQALKDDPKFLYAASAKATLAKISATAHLPAGT